MRVDVKAAEDIPEEKPLADYQFGETAYFYLDKMVQLCEDKGIQLILIKAPSLYPHWYEEWEVQMEEYAREQGTFFVLLCLWPKVCRFTKTWRFNVKKIKMILAMAIMMMAVVVQSSVVCYAAEEETIPVVEQQEVDLADGNYTVSVDLEGGSGRASITTPTSMTVSGKKATATIVWSSSNYDYMLVNGEKYLPTNTEGNSTFEIPVLCMDEPMTVIADTTAMSTPHEITYILTFYSDSVAGEQTTAGGIDPTLIMLIGVVVLTAAVFSLSATKKK